MKSSKTSPSQGSKSKPKAKPKAKTKSKPSKSKPSKPSKSKPSKPSKSSKPKTKGAAVPKKAPVHKEGDLQAILDAVRAPEIEKWGLSIGQLLVCYLRVFAQRPDIHVRDHVVGLPTPSAILTKLAGKVPPFALSLAAEVGHLNFCWVFEDKKAGMENLSEGANGGRLNLEGFLRGFRWNPRPEYMDATFKAQALWDDVVTEAATYLSYEPAEQPVDAKLVFDTRDGRIPLGTASEYLTEGAKRGFTWYWQRFDYWEALELTKRLYAASLPRTTPTSKVTAALVEKGLSPSEAQALVAWLGADAVILLAK